MKDNFRRINDLISQSLKSFNLEHKVKERYVLYVWDDVVGSRISNAASADNIKEGVLFISCKNATWAHELTFMKADIMKKLNSRLGGQYVKDIRFSTRTRKEAHSEEPVEEQVGPSEKELEDIRLSGEEERWIEDTASRAGNDELALRMRKALAAGRKMEKWKIAHGWKRCDSCGSLFEERNETCPVCGK